MRNQVRLALLLLLASVNTAPALAQDSGADDQAAEATSPRTRTDTADEQPVEADDESYLDIDEEDFTPSEEIPADQSIAFPTDI